jgi:hypothetical protein
VFNLPSNGKTISVDQRTGIVANYEVQGERGIALMRLTNFVVGASFPPIAPPQDIESVPAPWKDVRAMIRGVFGSILLEEDTTSKLTDTERDGLLVELAAAIASAFERQTLESLVDNYVSLSEQQGTTRRSICEKLEQENAKFVGSIPNVKRDLEENVHRLPEVLREELARDFQAARLPQAKSSALLGVVSRALSSDRYSAQRQKHPAPTPDALFKKAVCVPGR